MNLYYTLGIAAFFSKELLMISGFDKLLNVCDTSAMVDGYKALTSKEVILFVIIQLLPLFFLWLLWCHPAENYNKLGLCISIILFFLSKAYKEYNNIIEKDNSANKYKNFKMLLNLLMCGVIIVGLYIHNNVKDGDKSKNLLLGWFVIILLYLLISAMKDFNEYSYSNNNSLYDRNFLDGLINLIIFVVLSLRYLSDIGLNVKKEDVLLQVDIKQLSK